MIKNCFCRLEESYKVSQDTRKISIPLRTTEGIRPFSPGRLSDIARPVTAPVGPVRPIDLYRSRHEFQDRDSEGKPRQIDLRYSIFELYSIGRVRLILKLGLKISTSIMLLA